jgi:hypothetical protein
MNIKQFAISMSSRGTESHHQHYGSIMKEAEKVIVYYLY